MRTALFVATLLVPALATADPTPRKLMDAAVDGTGKQITKAFFFSDEYLIRYDWGKDRVDDGYPVPIGSFISDADFTGGIDAGVTEWAQPTSAVFRRGPSPEILIVDVNTKTERRVPNHNFAGGVDSAVHGLGPLANFVFFFKDAEVTRFDRRTKQVAATGLSTAIELKLDAAFAERIDAAVNGAGNFVGHAYLFHDDQYVKYDWANKRPVPGYPTRTQPKFPGLVEMLEIAHGLTASKGWLATALPALRRDLVRAGRGLPSSPNVAAALAAHFHITTVDERVAHLPAIIARLEAVQRGVDDPTGKFKFRTEAEARKLGLERLGIIQESGQIMVTPAFHDETAACQAIFVATALLWLDGMTGPADGVTGTAAALASPFSYPSLARQIATGATDNPCLKS